MAVGNPLRKARQFRKIRNRCDAGKIITEAQLNDDGSSINDCLGHPDGALVDNIEDLDTVVGFLAETTPGHSRRLRMPAKNGT